MLSIFVYFVYACNVLYVGRQWSMADCLSCRAPLPGNGGMIDS